MLEAPTVRATWYESVQGVAGLDVSAEHITWTPEWAGAWEKVTTERIRDFRHLYLSLDDDRDDRDDGGDDGRDRPHGGAELVSYYLVDHCPFWTENEQVIGVEPVWPDAMVYAPSPYAEYGGAGGSRPEFTARAIEGGLALAREWGATGVVFANLTPDMLARWCAVRPPSAALLFDVAYSKPVGGSVEAFLAGLPGSHVRREFRRQWRRGLEAGLTIRILHGAEMLPVLDDFAALTVDTSQSHGYNMYGADLFHAVATVPGAVMIAAEHDGALAGGFLCLRHGDRMSAWTAGIDYDRLRELRTYGVLTYEAVQYAAATGAALIDMGRSNHRYKQNLGFDGVDLYAAVYLTQPDQRLLDDLARMHRLLEARNHAGYVSRAR